MIIKFFKSLGYALKGIWLGIREERNVRIDIVMALYVLFFSSFYQFDSFQIALIILICFLVPAFEMMNTSVERTVKDPHPDRYMIAGEAKDTAAGAVLIVAVGALLAGAVTFWDIEILTDIYKYYSDSLSNSLALAGSLVLAYCFIISDKLFKKKNRKK
ncbi:MAG: diacylglycerol kinase family protein [Oscillospiraceae bacterium]